MGNANGDMTEALSLVVYAEERQRRLPVCGVDGWLILRYIDGSSGFCLSLAFTPGLHPKSSTSSSSVRCGMFLLTNFISVADLTWFLLNISLLTHCIDKDAPKPLNLIMEYTRAGLGRDNNGSTHAKKLQRSHQSPDLC